MTLTIAQHDGGVVVLTLDDPERRNAMTAAMGDALRDAVRDLAEDPSLRVVVVTGTPPAFSAGGDLDMLEDLARRAREEGFDATATMRAFYERFLALRDLPVPVVAAVNGAAVGAGLCVALACDVRLVAEDAKLGLNFARLGLHPGMGATWLLPRAVGPQRAAELLFTGRLFSGREAAAYGLALEALTATDVVPRALEVAAEIADSSPVVVRQLKATLAHVERSTLPDSLDREAANQSVSYGSADLAEGLLAARERRAPDFPGH